MARLTSKYQLTLPRAIAQRIGLKPGDEIDCEAAGDMVRVKPKVMSRTEGFSITDRLVLFDLASERVRHREHSGPATRENVRDWTRDELYER